MTLARAQRLPPGGSAATLRERVLSRAGDTKTVDSTSGSELEHNVQGRDGCGHAGRCCTGLRALNDAEAGERRTSAPAGTSSRCPRSCYEKTVIFIIYTTSTVHGVQVLLPDPPTCAAYDLARLCARPLAHMRRARPCAPSAPTRAHYPHILTLYFPSLSLPTRASTGPPGRGMAGENDLAQRWRRRRTPTCIVRILSSVRPTQDRRSL